MARPRPKGSGLTPGSRQRNKGGKITKKPNVKS